MYGRAKLNLLEARLIGVLTAIVIDFASEPLFHAETHLEAAPIRKRVRDEVHRPALGGPMRDRHRRPRAQGALAATATAHHQALLDVDAPNASG